MSRQRQASKSPRRVAAAAANDAPQQRTARTAHRTAAPASEPNYVVSVAGRPASAAAQSSAAVSPAAHTRSAVGAAGLPPAHRAGHRSNGSSIDSPLASAAHARADSHSSNGSISSSSGSRAKSPHGSRRPPPHASSPAANLSGSNLTVFVPRVSTENGSGSNNTFGSPSSHAAGAHATPSRLPIATSSTLLLAHNQARPAASHSTHTVAAAASPAAHGRAARSPKFADVVLLTGGSRGSSGHNSPAQLSPRLQPAAAAAVSGHTDSSFPALESAAKPVVSVSLSSATAEEEARAAAARKKQHHRHGISLDEDVDDPSQPIAERRARAVQWMLQTIDLREEPLYCPSWFTAVDPAAMLHLSDVRQHYLSLVHSFSLREQALSYIDDVHDAWLAEKTKLKARSKINMMRALQGKPLLISTQGTLQRMPGFMPPASASTATATASPASTAASASPSSPSPLSTAALINGAAGTAGGSVTPRASARSVTSTAAAMLLHSSAASPPPSTAALSPSAAARSPVAATAASPASPAAAAAAAAAPSAAEPLPSARSRLANLSALLAPASGGSSSAQQQQQNSSQLLSPSSAAAARGDQTTAAGLNGTIAGLSPIARPTPAEADESALGADVPSRSSAALPPPPPPASVALDALLQGVDPSSLSAADLEAFAAMEVLLDSFPLLIKHSPDTVAPASADGIVSVARSKSKAPKLSELKLVGSRLFYGWKAHRKRNKKFVRLRDIVHVKAGLSERITQKHEPLAPGSTTAAPTLLDEYCFRIESMDSSTEPPTPCELNLQADSTQHRAQWIDGIRLLARFERSRIEAAQAEAE